MEIEARWETRNRTPAHLWALGIILLLLAGCTIQRAGTGKWSVPSLSQPSMTMTVILRPDGTATEKIGSFRGEGFWRPEGQAARISWESGWSGLLRPASGGRKEMLTWKAGSSTKGAPDDAQPATYLGAWNLVEENFP